MGKDQVMVGAQMEDATASLAPFDARYIYLAGQLPEEGACQACSEACNYWWGCWQDYAEAPGQYAVSFISKAEGATWQGSKRPQIPFITYYVELHASGLEEGPDQVAALNDAAFLTRYLKDWRTLLTTIDQHPAMLHIEPDFWGYVRQVNSNPHLVPARVAAANPTDCGTEEDSAAGVARCMIHMVRKYSPNALVGLHASAWLMADAADGQAISAFLKELGAAEADFIVTDPSDRDAGYYQTMGRDTWWDDAKAQAYLDWTQTVSESLCKPAILWQLPVGNMSLENMSTQWHDNRVDWLLSHMSQVSAAHVVALLFGSGASGQTTPETDGGNLVAKTKAYREAGGMSLCE